MIDLLFLVAAIFDGLIVGVFLATLCKLILGDKPLARLLKLIVSVGAGIGYSIWVLSVGGSDEGTMAGFLILTLAPIALVFILAIIGYMFNEKSDK